MFDIRMKIYSRNSTLKFTQILHLFKTFREDNLEINYFIQSYLTFSGNQNRKSNYIFFREESDQM